MFSAGGRPPFEGFYIYALIGLIAYFAADLTVVHFRPKMLPTNPPPTRPNFNERMEMKGLDHYSSVFKKNIFNEDGKIPDPISEDGSSSDQNRDADPVLTQLPIKLEGTLVHADPRKSIATIMIQAKNQTQTFMIDDDMEGMGKVVRVERRKLIFRNSSNQRLEYVEIPKDSALAFGRKSQAPAATGAKIQQTSDYSFTVSRSEIEAQLANLGEVLNQARMVPNIVPGTGGKVQGFRFVSIKDGSVFSNLGFKPMDVINSVNGEEVNSPTKAMELYQALRNSDNVKVGIVRNGQAETMDYTVTK
ncbi:PDZ domain-containing protein [bacterium]|nr:PDZ domain-containing protein [bacterium]